MSVFQSQNRTYYHGTTLDAAERLCREQIIRLEYAYPFTDFGKAFYTTSSLEQARRWARLKSSMAIGTQNQAKENPSSKIEPAVVQVTLSLHDLFGLRTLAFGSVFERAEDCNGFYEFVTSNRTKTGSSRLSAAVLGWDIVIGPVASLRYSMPKGVKEQHDQIAFVSEYACSLLTNKICLVPSAS